MSDIRVALSTSSVYPEPTPDAFEIAARLGYDGVEIMVYPDPVSQDADVLRRLSDYHQLPVLSVHAPSLLLTQRVWGREPWGKLRRAKELAEALGAGVVVVHPPFRWQREYARGFEEGIAKMADETDVIFAVENMYPLRAGATEVTGYAPHWDPTRLDVDHVTLDLSHTAASGSNAMAMAVALGEKLAHVHLADGTGTPVGPIPDEHLVPGRGSQPCAELLQRLAATGFPGTVVVEVKTHRAPTSQDRVTDLAESLAFARGYLSSGDRKLPCDSPSASFAAPSDYGGWPRGERKRASRSSGRGGPGGASRPVDITARTAAGRGVRGVGLYPPGKILS